MHIRHIISTNFGRRSLPAQDAVQVVISRGELHHLVRAIERDAITAEREGLFDVATKLAWRAASLRETAR